VNRWLVVAAVCAVGGVRTANADEPPVVVEPSPPPERERVTVRAGPAELEAGAIVQLDASRGGPHPGYGVRRARLRLAARLERLLQLGVRLEAELSPLADEAEAQGLLDAVIELRLASRGLPEIGRLALGQMLVPFSAEAQDAPEDLILVERAGGARRLAPGRDVGLRYSLRLARGPEAVTLHLGIFNGEGAGRPGGGRGSMDALRLEGLAGDPSRARLGGRWGLAFAVNPDAELVGGPALALLYGGDVAVHYRALQLGAELVWRTAEGSPDAGAAWTWISLDLIPDVLAAVARVETLDEGGDALPERWLTFGGTFFYLGQRFRLAYDVALPLAPVGPRQTWHVASFMAVL
jgi:hypothetical protein